MTKGSVMLVFLGLAFLLAHPVEKGWPIKMEEMAVAAPQTKQALEEVPWRIQLITPKDIQKALWQKADNLLDNLSGVSIVRQTIKKFLEYHPMDLKIWRGS